MSTSNSTFPPTEEHPAGYVAFGYVALLISCTSFGTMFTPLKRRDTKDGNVFSVPIINGLGMGIGFLIWGSMQIIVGWSVARFGLLGILAPTEMKHNLLNYIGMVITLISGVLFIFVKHKDQEKKLRTSVPSESTALESRSTKDTSSSGSSKKSISKDHVKTASSESTALESHSDRDATDAQPLESSLNKEMLLRKLPYIIMTMFLAILHGLMMSPLDILKQRHPSNDPYRGWQ
ncbi:hypothetical protein TELCIR_04293, partial [Teladorsagia circumcincta]